MQNLNLQLGEYFRWNSRHNTCGSAQLHDIKIHLTAAKTTSTGYYLLDLFLSHLSKGFLSNAHSDKLIYVFLLLLNLKMSITKITRVSFGNTKNYMQENLKMTLLLIRSSWKHQLTYKWWDFFQYFLFSKLVSPIKFHQSKFLKQLWKMLLISPTMYFLVLEVFKFFKFSSLFKVLRFHEEV